MVLFSLFFFSFQPYFVYDCWAKPLQNKSNSVTWLGIWKNWPFCIFYRFVQFCENCTKLKTFTRFAFLSNCHRLYVGIFVWFHPMCPLLRKDSLFPIKSFQSPGCACKLQFTAIVFQLWIVPSKGELEAIFSSFISYAEHHRLIKRDILPPESSATHASRSLWVWLLFPQ